MYQIINLVLRSIIWQQSPDDSSWIETCRSTQYDNIINI
jgi:hypothetical protein